MNDISFSRSYTETNAPVWILNENRTCLLWANNAGMRYWGLDPDTENLETQKQHSLSDLITGLAVEPWQQLSENCESLSDSMFTELVLSPNGVSHTPLNVRISPLNMESQQQMLLFYGLNSYDQITPTTTPARQSAEHTDALLALYNTDGSLRYENPAMSNGVAVENTSFTSLFSEPEIASKIQHTLETEELVEIEHQLLTNDGLRWHSLTIRRVPAMEEQTELLLVTAVDSDKWHQAEQAANDLAHKDVLTNLPNRAAMSAYLRSLIKSPSQNVAKFGLFFLDLDRFKVINDSLGHSAGDSLLVEVAKRLLISNGEHGNVYRLGGDEFVVIFDQQTSTEQLTENAQNILDVMSTPAKVGEHTLRIRPSIGICTYPADGKTITEILAYADAAMYLAKAEGTGYRFYDARMTKTHAETAKRRMSLENDLASAVELNQFELYYQPKISCVDLTVSGVEALLRWHHPEKGMVPPDEFIKIAEESSQIMEIGRWVLEAAMKQQQAWRESGISVPVAINISAGQFHTGDLVNQVSESMRATGCDPEMIELEITESMLLGDGDHIQDTLQHLSSMGIKLSLDDFGTGFSNLAYLQKYPLDVLKIDRIFLADQKRSMLMGTILNMGKVLGLSVVAEGVENAVQADWLISKGCDQLQGFYFSTPLPVAEATQYLLDHGTEQVRHTRSAA